AQQGRDGIEVGVKHRASILPRKMNMKAKSPKEPKPVPTEKLWECGECAGESKDKPDRCPRCGCLRFEELVRPAHLGERRTTRGADVGNPDRRS
ncbi:MAG: hypothetical protein ACREJC_11155, partial [Tepidisphaeraceae bacterium]